MNKCLRSCMAFLLAFSAAYLQYFPCLEQNAAYAEDKSYTIGGVPQFEQRKLFAIWKPIIEDLEKRTGTTFNLISTLTIGAFEKAIERGEFDFVYLNPYHIVQVHDKQGTP